MPGLIFKGATVVTPGITVVNYLDDPKLRLNLANDGGTRASSWVRHVTLHTTQGIPGGRDGRPFILRPGMGPVGRAAENNAVYWARATDAAGASLITDFDGTHVLCADLVTEYAWHGGGLSQYGVGWEIVQGATTEVSTQYPKGYAFCYADQINQGVVLMADELSRRLGIQRQLHYPWRRNQPVSRLAAGGKDVVGFHGHNDATTNRGQGDPGGVDPRTGDMDHIRKALIAAGYETFDFAADEDKKVWIERQKKLNTLLGLNLTLDGVPGPSVVAAIKQAYAAKISGLTHHGAKHGLWIGRPGDEVEVVTW